jgi:hypothetical protein
MHSACWSPGNPPLGCGKMVRIVNGDFMEASKWKK